MRKEVFLLLFFLTVARFLTAQQFVPDSAKSGQINDSVIIAQQGDSVKSFEQNNNDTLITFQVSEDAIKDPIDYSAKDSTILNLEERKVYLFKDAVIKYQTIELKANYIELDLEKNEVYATGLPDSTGKIVGKPVFKDGSEEFASDKLTYNFKSKKGVIRDIFSKYDDGYLHSEITKKMADNSVCIKHGKYTTCDCPHPHFYVAMTRAKVIPDDKIVSGPAYLVVADVPLPIGIPFGFFPSTRKRSSGILLPKYGEDNKRGFFLREGGFYWGISDYVDMTFRGEIYSYGSWALTNEVRYKKRYKYDGSMRLGYGKLVESEKGLPDYVERKNYVVEWSHSQDPKAHPSRQFSARVNFRSVDENKYNDRNPSDYLKNEFSSSINYRKKFTDTPFSTSVGLRHSQNNRDSIVDLTFPEMSLNMEKIFPFQKINSKRTGTWYQKLGFSLNSTMRNTVRVKQDKLFENSTLDEFKYGVKHTIPLSTSIKVLKYFIVTPSANYTERWYFNKLHQRYDSTAFIQNGDTVLGEVITDTLEGFYRVFDYSYGTSLSTTVYGMYQFTKGPVKAIRHKVIPTVGFIYTPDFSTKKWGYYEEVPMDTTGRKYQVFGNGIFGSPSSGRSGNVSMGLSNNLEMKILSKKDTANGGVKKVSILDALNFNTSYNLLADSMNWAPLSASARTSFFKIINISSSASFKMYDYVKVKEKVYHDVNQFNWENGKPLLRLTNLSLSGGFTISSETFKKKNAPKKADDSGPRRQKGEYEYFSVPWSFNVSYSFSYSKPYEEKNKTQTLSFGGNFELTKNWKVTYSSGYDIKNKDFTYTRLAVSRNLHCWSMSADFIPFGTYKSYSFKIGVNPGVLQDLKYDKKQSWWEGQNY